MNDAHTVIDYLEHPDHADVRIVLFIVAVLLISIVFALFAKIAHKKYIALKKRITDLEQENKDDLVKAMEGLSEKFNVSLTSHDEKNSRDFAGVHKDIADVKKDTETIFKEISGINKKLYQIGGAMKIDLPED